MAIKEIRRIVRNIDLALARSFAHDLASMKQTFSAALVRHLIGEIEYLRAELAKARSEPKPEAVELQSGVISVSEIEHGGASDGTADV